MNNLGNKNKLMIVYLNLVTHTHNFEEYVCNLNNYIYQMNDLNSIQFLQKLHHQKF
jgi:hypothetical protein